MEIKEVIQRLNELYHQSKKTPLTSIEVAERDQLRQQYLGFIRNQVKSSLDQVQVVSEDETKQKTEHCNCKGHCHHHH